MVANLMDNHNFLQIFERFMSASINDCIQKPEKHCVTYPVTGKRSTMTLTVSK